MNKMFIFGIYMIGVGNGMIISGLLIKIFGVGY